MAYYNDTSENIQALCDLIPGMSPAVARSWLRCEGQSINNPTNPLNILYYGRSNQVAKSGRFAVYASALEGLKDAAALINHSSYYVGVRLALQSKDDVTIARAIEDSPWAGGHYGGGGAKDGCIVRGLGQVVPKPTPKPTPPPKPKPVPAGKNTYTVKPGDSLWAIAEKYYKDGNQWHKIYDANAGVIGPNPSLIRPGQKLIIP